MQKNALTILILALTVATIACFGTRKTPTPKQGERSKGSSQKAAMSSMEFRVQSIKAEVEKVLSEPPIQGYQPIPAGTQLLSVNVERKGEKEGVALLERRLATEKSGVSPN